MKLTAALIASTVAASVCATAQADARSQRPPCRSYAKTILANAQVKVFRRPFERDSARRPSGFYACDRRSRRLRYLGENADDIFDYGGGTRRIQLAGRYVTYEDRPCSRIECAESIVRVDVRNGARRRLVEPADTEAARDLALTRGGVVVWIRGARPNDLRYEIVRWDGTTITVLDSGPINDVHRESLAISGGRAYWFARGQAMSAIVDGPLFRPPQPD
jgi:hypothetical protein